MWKKVFVSAETRCTILIKNDNVSYQNQAALKVLTTDLTLYVLPFGVGVLRYTANPAVRVFASASNYLVVYRYATPKRDPIKIDYISKKRLYIQNYIWQLRFFGTM